MKSPLQSAKIARVLSFSAFFLLIHFSCFAAEDPTVSIVTDQANGLATTHGLQKVKEALKAKGFSYEYVGEIKAARGKYLLVAGLASGAGAATELLKKSQRSPPTGDEALVLWKTTLAGKTAWVLSGSDDRGLMYGLLDLADRIGWAKDRESPFGEVQEVAEKPAVGERAISVYTMNRAYWESRFYDEAYWARYLDQLAQNRFNSLVVIFGYENGGFLAPAYPYFFDVKEFPDVRMVGIEPQEQQRNLLALNRLIDMAHERGIRFTVGIWDHIYRGGVQGGGVPGTRNAPDQPVPGLVWGVTAENLTNYTKVALKKFLEVVPNLDAIQFRMHNESGLKEGEQGSFWADVFAMMRQTAPNLRLDLRAKELPEEVIQSALDAGINFRIATKYWMEQMGMPYHPTLVNPDKSPIRHSYAYLLRYPKKYRVHWRLWNGGTSRILLWGNPEYARRFAESTHLYGGDSFEINEPLATKMEAQPHDEAPFDLLTPPYRYYDYEFERYWHFFQVFGRLGYNPDADPAIWQRAFSQRFGEKAGPLVEAALHKASWVLPRIITSSYPYSMFPTTRGWPEKERLGDLPSFTKAALSDQAQFANFDDEAKLLLEGGETARVRPSANSRWFLQVSQELDQLISRAEAAMGNTKTKEFVSTITDLKILSKRALYHARRIPAAVNYRIFERTQNPAALDAAIAGERAAIAAWRELVAAAGDVYAPNLKMGVHVSGLDGHWKDELAELEKGLAELEQQRKTLSQVAPTKVSLLREADLENDIRANFGFSHKKIEKAPVGKPLNIEIKATSPAGIEWVRLRYRGVNQELAYETRPMPPSAEKHTYTVTVPAGQIDPQWDFMYYFEVMDKNGNGTIYPDLNKETPYVIVELVR